jgi:hypothetical protein
MIIDRINKKYRFGIVINARELTNLNMDKNVRILNASKN